MNLTDRFVQGAKAIDGKRTDYPDDKRKGLMIRVTPNDSKSWSLRYRRKSDGKRRRVTIGEYPTFSLSDARAKANEIMVEVAQGKDPAKTAKRPASTTPRTFGELAARYIEAHADNRSLGEDKQMLKKDILPAFEGEPVDAITRADIIAIGDSIIARGSLVRANRTFSTIRKIFNWGVGRGYVQYAPTFQMNLPAKEKSRQRVLSNAEMKIFWRRIIAREQFSREMRVLLKLLLVTGQRVSEVAGMARSELHLDKAEWHLPGERTKNGLYHIVPLGPLAIHLIEKALKHSEGSPLVLPSPTTGAQIMKGAPAYAIRRNRELFGFDPPFTPHDLRRTLGSGLGELGFPRLVQDKVLNHADSSIGSIYDRYAYGKEKREALEAWADYLQEIVFDRPRAVVVSASSVSRAKKPSSPWTTA